MSSHSLAFMCRGRTIAHDVKISRLEGGAANHETVLLHWLCARSNRHHFVEAWLGPKSSALTHSTGLDHVYVGGGRAEAT